jgi:glycosyltransferase involved in cell wall biosynthesis
MSVSPTVMSVLYLDPLKFGSMEEYTVHLSRALRERGWQSVLVFAKPIPEVVSAYFDGVGAVIETFQDGPAFERNKSLIRIIRKYHPAVIHFHFFNQFSILPILASLVRPKLVVFTDHVRQGGGISRITKVKCFLYDRTVLRLLNTKILAVSEHIKRILVNDYQMSPQTIRVLYNGVNLQRFLPLHTESTTLLRNELNLRAGRPVVLCASNLRPEKGISDLLVAAKEILAQKPDCVFLIVGGGPMADRLTAEALELGIHKSVRFTGLRSDVNQLMQLANVVVVPSTWQEPAALVLLEAMAAFRPLVATRVGGSPELLADGVTGILVEPRTPNQLARAILRLLDSPEEAAAMGRAGRARVEGQFTIERWVKDTMDLYEKSMPITAQQSSR